MVDAAESAAWTWDARPYPFFPGLTDVWTDGANWRLGHWLTGRLGAVSLAALVRHLCLRAGLAEELIDVSGLWGAVEGYAITALESPRASISMLARHFGFDAVESEGRIRFAMRGRAAVGTVAPGEMVPASAGADPLEITRAQETELPRALKWQLARADEEYDPAIVEARRITVQAARVAAETHPVAVPPEEAERRCRRALMESWVGRESASFRLPPSRLALNPGDVIRLDHDGRLIDLRIVSTADGERRGIEAILDDRALHDLPPGATRASTLGRVVFGTTTAVFMNVPRLRENIPAHLPLLAAWAKPLPGRVSVYRSPTADAFRLLTSSGRRANISTLAGALRAGPTSRFDLGNALVVDLAGGNVESVSDLSMFLGANAFAVQAALGAWEIIQVGAAELVAPGRYRLTRLLRGQRGTEWAMAASVSAGARVVALNDLITPLPITEVEIGIEQNWRTGPASRPMTDGAYAASTFTPTAEGLRPFPVVHVEQPWRRGRTPGDYTIRWTRRDRALAAASFDANEAPMSEEREAYEVDILDGATAKRTLPAIGPSVIYTADQQIADWDALLGPGDTLDLRIAQVSALLGRGHSRDVTLTF